MFCSLSREIEKGGQPVYLHSIVNPIEIPTVSENFYLLAHSRSMTEKSRESTEPSSSQPYRQPVAMEGPDDAIMARCDDNSAPRVSRDRVHVRGSTEGAAGGRRAAKRKLLLRPCRRNPRREIGEEPSPQGEALHVSEPGGGLRTEVSRTRTWPWDRDRGRLGEEALAGAP